MADGPRWAHVVGPFRGFGHRFEIGSDDEAVASFLGELWSGCAEDCIPTTTYGVSVRDAFALHVDGDVTARSENPSIVVRDLVRRINRDVIAGAGELVVVHASGAARDGAGVVFPAAMESGKTTLVTGLVRAGWRYLSDEAVGIDPNTLELVPYPKPLSIDPGSWALFADLQPAPAGVSRSFNDEQWQVAPVRIRSDAVSPSVPARTVIAPAYGPGATTTLWPLSRPQGLRTLADSCFNLREHAGRALEVIAEVVRRCDCYRLEIDDLDEAVASVARAITS